MKNEAKARHVLPGGLVLWVKEKFLIPDLQGSFGIHGAVLGTSTIREQGSKGRTVREHQKVPRTKGSLYQGTTGTKGSTIMEQQEPRGQAIRKQ